MGELLLLVYVLYQRWPSLSYHSPGVPGLKWFLEHIFNLCASACAGFWVYRSANFERKPWECAQSDAGICVDSRSKNIIAVLTNAVCYWVCRIAIMVLMNRAHVPMFIYGTPDSKARKAAGRGGLRTCA